MSKTPNITIDFTDQQNLIKFDEDFIVKSCKKMVENFSNQNQNFISKSEFVNFDILFCDNKFIQELNLQYRDKDCPTDVLSFALFVDNEFLAQQNNEQIHLGEIIVSIEKAKQQAKENSKTIDQEVFFLLSHGLLHLLGYDHPDEESLNKMLEIQESMIKDIGTLNV